MIALGRAIAAMRCERGLKRMELVVEAAVSYPFLAEIESGKKNPSKPTLDRIADALKVTPSELLAYAEMIERDPRNGIR